MSDYISVGRIGKPHGLKGIMKIEIDDRAKPVLAGLQAFFIEIGGAVVPYFIEYIRQGNDILLKLEGVDSREDAAELRNHPLLLSDENLPAQKEQHDWIQLEGFVLFNGEDEEIGLIKEVIDYQTHQVILIDYQGKEVLIPLHDSLVQSLEAENKRIFMQLPDGLLDL